MAWGRRRGTGECQKIGENKMNFSGFVTLLLLLLLLFNDLIINNFSDFHFNLRLKLPFHLHYIIARAKVYFNLLC